MLLFTPLSTHFTKESRTFSAIRKRIKMKVCKYCNCEFTSGKCEETGLPHVDRTVANANTMNVETVLDHYIIAALWSTNDESDESGGQPLDKNYSREDIDDDTIQAMRDEVTRFVEINHQALQTWDQDQDQLPGWVTKTTPEEQAGHDFWLTRNGHGCGFWEDEWGTKAIRDQLTNSAKRFGERYLFVNDDTNTIYQS